jgi:hypothetical protein
VQRTQLDGKDFLLKFDWNDRTGHWYLSIADTDDAAILTGRQLSTDCPILLGCTDARRPSGDLFVRDLQGSGDDPGFSDLGSRFVLLYFTRDEIRGTA